MKKYLLSIALIFPLWGIAQFSYEVKFTDLQTFFQNAGSGINDQPTNYTDVKLTKDDVDKAKIIITGITQEQANDMKLHYRNEDSTQVIAFSFRDNVLEYNLMQDLDPADNKFDLKYKNIVVAVFQFQRQDNTMSSGKSKTTNPSETYLSAFASANFVGDNKFLSNLTPVVNLGGTVNFLTLTTPYKDKSNRPKSRIFKWDLDVNPYLGAQINTRDSASFIPALMLPGRAGLQLNNYLSWNLNGAEIIWMPFGFGLKIIPELRDSSINIWQHNFRTGIAFRYNAEFLLSAQLTYGFHNTTSESRKFYNTVFSKNATDITYLTLTGQFRINSENESQKQNYLYMEWRGLLSKKSYIPFNNIAIITLGFRKNISIGHAFPSSNTNRGKSPKYNSLF